MAAARVTPSGWVQETDAKARVSPSGWLQESAGGATGVTGTGALTTPLPTFSATGFLTIKGTSALAATLPTLSAAGDVYEKLPTLSSPTAVEISSSSLKPRVTADF